MENLNNIDEPNKKPHPKPTDDPGAEIETVTPDSQQESLPNDQSKSSDDTKEESLPDAKVKESSTPEGQENNSGSESPEIETVTPDAKNEDSSDDSEKAPEETEEEEETEDENSKKPGVSKDENDGAGIETVTPT